MEVKPIGKLKALTFDATNIKTFNYASFGTTENGFANCYSTLYRQLKRLLHNVG